MSSNSDTVKQHLEEIKQISRDLRELVYSAPSQWVWDSTGSAVSIEQIAEVIEKIERDVWKVQQYCDEVYKESTNMLLAVMWSGLQTKNNEAIIHAAKQLINIKIDFEREPFRLKPK
ncbi:MAG: hypothetical protein ACE5KA_01525 [Nitrososphaerales archaeon]